MCYYIGIEDLVANALIEKLKNDKERFISYHDIEEYGAMVIQFLNNKNEKAVLILSRQRTNSLLRDYSDFFTEVEKDETLGIELNENVSSDALISKFRGYLPLDMLLAFIDSQSLKAIGV